MDLAAAGSVPAVARLYDNYGAALYRLALIVVGDSGRAETAVCEGFRRARAHPLMGEAPEDAWRELVRLTMLAAWTMAGTVRTGSALLGLTLIGDHTYREAALVLDMEPDEAAGVLRAALREVGRRP